MKAKTYFSAEVCPVKLHLVFSPRCTCITGKVIVKFSTGQRINFKVANAVAAKSNIKWKAQSDGLHFLGYRRIRLIFLRIQKCFFRKSKIERMNAQIEMIAHSYIY